MKNRPFLKKLLNYVRFGLWLTLNIMFFTLPKDFRSDELMIVPFYLVIAIIIPMIIIINIASKKDKYDLKYSDNAEYNPEHSNNIVSIYCVGCILCLIFGYYFF